MKTLLYCYGPFSTEKDSFCEDFSSENKEYSIVSCCKIRKKISGSAIIKDKAVEIELKQSVINECINILNKKNKNIILNGLFLNEESRLDLLNSIDKIFNKKIKKVAIAFLPVSSTSTYEKLKEEKDFKDIDFEQVRNQFFNFKLAQKQDEGDVLIYQIDNYGGKFHMQTKLWGKDERISCDNLKKVSEYIKYTNSFNT